MLAEIQLLFIYFLNQHQKKKKTCKVLNALFSPFGHLVCSRPLICEAKQALQTKVI